MTVQHTGLSLCFGFLLFTFSAGAALPEYNFELWGRTSYGDGYVYGPAYRSSGVTVADLDVDGDYDFVMPSLIGKPQVMRNLGNDRAFFPGGVRTVNMADPASGVYLSQYMDFGDLTGDGLPDAVAVGSNYSAGKSSIYWYRNDGPRDNPVFTVIAQAVYTSPQAGMACGAVDLADLNNDGKLDLCWVEFTMSPPSAAPKLYYRQNTGSATAPAWGTKQELASLSSLLPPPRAVKKKDQADIWAHPRLRAAGGEKGAKVLYEDLVKDMEFGDWDADGDLDFMFYDARWGVDWVLCVNATAAVTARWDTIVNRSVTPYRHAAGFGENVAGSFAVRPGPGLAQYPDFFVAVEGYLLTWRFNAKGGQYEVVQENAVAHDSGTGPPAFWDYDFDGDLDMFRTEFKEGATNLLLVPNVGTPYSAIWDWAVPLPDIGIDPGSAADQYRQELYTFADGDGDGYQEFFLQDRDGELFYYRLLEATESDPYPYFYGLGAIMAPTQYIVYPDATNVQPRGIAVADFNMSGDGVCELITCWSSDQYVRVVYLAQDPFFRDLDWWLDPIDLPLNNAQGQPLNKDLVEGLTAADLDRDGRPDLVLTLSSWLNYKECTHAVYRNVELGNNTFGFQYAGEITAPQDVDNGWARMIGLADVDTDSDVDLFVGHQYLDESQPNEAFNRYPYLHFYRNDTDPGIKFWQTRVVSGQEWTFTIGGTQPLFEYVLNASGGSFVNGVYRAGPVSQVTDIIQSTNASPNYRIYIDVLPQVGSEAKAVLVVGGQDDDPLYGAFEFLTGQAYNALLLQGIAPENIRLYTHQSYDADGDGASDRFAAPTLTGLQSAVTSWAVGSSRLLVYLVDHGQRDRFRLNSVDYLEAATYDGWLDTLQAATPNCVVTTVIDTCEAGSFIDNLKLTQKARKAGSKRITMTGSGVGPTQGLALFDQKRSLSFSLPFWEEIRNGSTYGHAFATAKVAIESINPLQVPQIDDNGNGVANELSDGLEADIARPGADFQQPSPGVFIGDVAPNQAISANSATLWLSDVVAGFPVEAAGALIVPPNLDRASAPGDDEQPMGANIEWIDFTYNAAQKRWQGNYGGFTSGGLYRIQYYVRVLGNYHASPRIGFVDRINQPDAWEPDGTVAAAPWLSVNFVQGHNFHQSGDVDWARFVAPANMKATIAVLAPGPKNQPVVELYRAAEIEANAQATPVQKVESPAPGREVVFERTFTTSEPYLLKIYNKTPQTFGEGSSYLLMVAAGTGGTAIQNILVVTIRENGTETLLGSATVKVNGGGDQFNSKTTAGGDVQFICKDNQRYDVEAAKSGYKTGTGSIRINNIIENIELRLVKDTVPTVSFGLSANRSNVKATVDGSEYDLPQSLVVQVNSQHTVAVPAQLSDGSVFDRWSDGSTNRSRTVNVATANLSLEAQYKAPSGTDRDINNDGATNAVDVQLVVNAVLGLDIGFDPDVNDDGSINAIDVQNVVNGVLGVN